MTSSVWMIVLYALSVLLERSVIVSARSQDYVLRYCHLVCGVMLCDVTIIAIAEKREVPSLATSSREEPEMK
jgi:hypothetical protein